MKILFWLVLLVNLILVALWGAGAFNSAPVVLPQSELNAASIRLAGIAAEPTVAPVSTVHEVPEKIVPVSAVASAVPAAPTVVAEANVPPVCMEWGGFSGAELVRANKLLAGMSLGNKLSQRQTEQTNGYWVYIPPLKDKIAVTQKLVQLKARGVEDYFVVQDDTPLNNAISLGVFKTEDAAKKFLVELQGKGVRTALVGGKSGKLKSVAFIFNSIDHTSANRLGAMQKEFGDSQLKNVPCALTR
jgi:hypothetical protein